jgi:CRP/FNR family transcriptional regulator, cyclic AMP receptor protein
MAPERIDFSNDALRFINVPGTGRFAAKYRRRQILFSQGNPANSIHYIQEGKVKLTVVSPQGKEAVIAVLGPECFLGEECLTGRPVNQTTVTAITPVSTVRMEKQTFQQLMDDEPVFSRFFTDYLLSRKARIEEDLIDHLFNSSEKRLARTLLLLAGFGEDGKMTGTPFPRISQETLAEMVGTTRARVSFFMNRFRKAGYVEYRDKIQVNHTLLNVVLRD